MSLSPDALQRLVRRDVAVAGGGSAVALVCYVVLVAGRAGIGISPLTADRTILAAAAIVAASALAAWASGPRELRRDRYIVFVPVCLIAPPALLSLADLGAGLVVFIFSGAVGVGAAIAGGLAWSARRR